MLKTFKVWLRSLFAHPWGLPAKVLDYGEGSQHPHEINPAQGGSVDSRPIANAYDTELLDRARMQWQFGDWESLGRLDEITVEHHPERAKLALLVASAHQQLNDHANARHFIKLAQTWGCDKKLIAGLLIAGVHNTLGRAAAVMQDDNRALEHFKAAVEGVRGDARLACHARLSSELAQLHLRDSGSSSAVFANSATPKAADYSITAVSGCWTSTGLPPTRAKTNNSAGCSSSVKVDNSTTIRYPTG